MYWATWGTSSTIRRRVWSLLEPLDMGPDDTTRPCSEPEGSGTLRDQDGALGTWPEGAEVVAAGEQLDP